MSVVIIFCLLTPLSILPYFLILPFSSLKARAYVHAFISTGIKVVLYLTGIRVHVEGAENFPQDPKKPFLLVSNHQSAWDPVMLITFLPRIVGFYSKKSVLWFFPVNIWMISIGCVFIDRKSPRAAMKSIEKGINMLKEGNSIGIFPEGTRSKGGDMNSFKKGSFRLAFQSGACILPVMISGTYKLWEIKGSVKPTDVYIKIYPTIETKDLTQEQKKSLPEKIWDSLHHDLHLKEPQLAFTSNIEKV